MRFCDGLKIKKETKAEIMEIMTGMVFRNLENGATWEEAKESCFNKFNSEYPEILNFFVNMENKEVM